MANWTQARVLQYSSLTPIVVLFFSVADSIGTKIVRRAFGTAEDCTYEGIRLVDDNGLLTIFEKVVGEDDAPALGKVKGFMSSLRNLTIDQAICENGHLPARKTGPTSFEFVAAGGQCPICRARVGDAPYTQFGYNWVERTLAHPDEVEVEVGSRLIPISREGMMAVIGTLASEWEAAFTKLGEQAPTIQEMADYLYHEDLQFKDKPQLVLSALASPGNFHIDSWECETRARNARGRWKSAKNPFRVVAETSDKGGGGPPPPSQPAIPAGAVLNPIFHVMKFYSSPVIKAFQIYLQDSFDEPQALRRACKDVGVAVNSIAFNNPSQASSDLMGYLDYDQATALIKKIMESGPAAVKSSRKFFLQPSQLDTQVTAEVDAFLRRVLAGWDYLVLSKQIIEVLGLQWFVKVEWGTPVPTIISKLIKEASERAMTRALLQHLLNAGGGYGRSATTPFIPDSADREQVKRWLAPLPGEVVIGE